MSYRKALEALERYEPRRLAREQYRSPDGLLCAIAVLCPATRNFRRLNEWNISNLFLIAEIGLPIIREIESLGLTLQQAEELQSINDAGYYATPEERYQHVLSWLREQVEQEEAGA